MQEPMWDEAIASKIVAFYLDNLGQGEHPPGSNLAAMVVYAGSSYLLTNSHKTSRMSADFEGNPFC